MTIIGCRLFEAGGGFLQPAFGRRRSRSLALLSCVSVALAAGCAAVPADSDGWRQSQREVLISRAEARWDGLIGGDYARAYSYSSPDYRSVVSLQQYQRKFGRIVNWRLARAKDVSYDSPTVASVSVEVTYQVGGSKVSGETVENVKLMTEKWLYKDGGWWYTDQ